MPRLTVGRPPRWEGVVAGVVANALATIVGWTTRGREHPADVVMIYLLGIVLVSLRYGHVASVFAAVLGVLGFDYFFVPPYHTFAVSDVGHLVTFGVLFVVAIVISQLTRRVRDQTEAAQQARVQVETEQLRNALLSSISHDLRTPLAVVTGAASSLLEDDLEPAVRRELTDTILEEARRLERRVQNLLDMTRVEAGTLQVHKQWQPIEEVVGSALRSAESILESREVDVDLPLELPMVPLDATLVEQVILNLLENATKYTPAGSPIRIAARVTDGALEIAVEDRGPGVAEAEATRIFEKFYRGRADRGGAGIGLTICSGIVAAHGGRIRVEPREGGGASFRFTLPIEGQPPTMTPPTGEDA